MSTLGTRMNAGRQFSDVLEDVAVDSTIADSDEIDARGYSRGSVEVPTGSTLTLLTFYGAHAEGGTHLPVLDSSHAAVTLVVAATEVCVLPAEIESLSFFSMKGNADGVVDLYMQG